MGANRIGMEQTAVERLREVVEKATPGPWDIPAGDENPIGDGRHVFATGFKGQRFVLANCKSSATFVTATDYAHDQANAAHIVNADRLARAIVKPGEREALAAIVKDGWIRRETWEDTADAILDHLSALALGDGG